MAANNGIFRKNTVADGRRVFFRNLPAWARNADLRAIVAPYSTVTQVRVIQAGCTGFATFPTAERAQMLIKAAGQGLVAIGNEMICAELARPQQQKTGPVAAVSGSVNLVDSVELEPVSAILDNPRGSKKLINSVETGAIISENVSCNSNQHVDTTTSHVAECAESDAPIATTKDYLSTLPLELWFEIFDYCDFLSVNRSRRVSKLFQALAETYFCRLRHFVVPTVTLPSRFLQPETAFQRALCFDTAQRALCFDTAQLSAMLDLLDIPELLSMDLVEGMISPTRLTRLMMECRSLRELSVKGDDLSSLALLPKDSLVSIYCDFTQINGTAVYSIIKRHENSLKKLVLLNNSKASPYRNPRRDHLLYLDQLYLPSGLQELTLGGRSTLYYNLSTYNLPNLISLRVDSHGDVTLPPSLPMLRNFGCPSRIINLGRGIDSLAAVCPQLTQLSLSSSVRATEQLLMGHANLRDLLCGLSRQTFHLISNLEYLCTQFSSDFTESDFRFLIAANKSLRELHVSELRSISGHTVIDTIEMCSELSLLDIAEGLEIDPEVVLAGLTTKRSKRLLLVTTLDLEEESMEEAQEAMVHLNNIYGEKLNCTVTERELGGDNIEELEEMKASFSDTSDDDDDDDDDDLNDYYGNADSDSDYEYDIAGDGFVVKHWKYGSVSDSD